MNIVVCVKKKTGDTPSFKGVVIREGREPLQEEAFIVGAIIVLDVKRRKNKKLTDADSSDDKKTFNLYNYPTPAGSLKQVT